MQPFKIRYPSTKMAISPMFFEQIEKFQSLKLSTTQGPSHGTKDMWHVSDVQKRVLKLVKFLVQYIQKPYMFDLGTHSSLICDALWSICHIGGLWAPLENCFVALHPCDQYGYSSTFPFLFNMFHFCNLMY